MSKYFAEGFNFFYKKILQQSLISNSSDHSLAKALILDKNKKEDVEFLNVLNSEKVMLKNMLEIISTNRSVRDKDNEIYANFGENLYTWGNYISIVHGRDKKNFSEGQNNDQIYKILAVNERLKIKRIIVISLIIFCFLSSLTLSLIAMRVGHL
ncbi:hypothetical protein [Chryseobacterium cheonjiense]|uniref:Uncharacterized protein n=1 Tax=Chryseobacterium cheonjiense TaxID=2728845 RepID=A0A7Y0A377_9FLAO|nr:hypothetical protein [Chryseobacterium cheonjiense]NML55848.1 hypothetical protein [Chryseobacterium cheonjiense]